MKNALRYFSLLCLAAVLIALPSLALAQESLGSGLTQFFDTPIATAGIVAVLGAIAACALSLTHYLPGWAARLNTIAGVATLAAMKIGLLGVKAGAVAILLAILGAWLGYERSEARAAGKSVLST